METKLCKKCGRTLSIDKFNKMTSSIDGLQAYCKECHREMTKEGYYKRKAKVQEMKTQLAVATQKSAPQDLSKFQPRELIEELRSRGYKGKLYLTREIIV